MAGVTWHRSFDEFNKMKEEITSLFRYREAIPIVSATDRYRFCDYEPKTNEWIINRHFFFPKMQDGPFVNLKTINTFNGKVSVKDWIDAPSKYDRYVLEVIEPILHQFNVNLIEFCGLHELNNKYVYSKSMNMWLIVK